MVEGVTLREYVESRLDALALAVRKAEEATDKRFSAVNEMRAMVTDAARNYLPRSEYDASHQALSDKLDAMQKMVWIGVGVVAALQFVVGAIVILWKR
jgi:ElaB/YqjD/DUF883 family membrane-anchored ribosome-binding protein